MHVQRSAHERFFTPISNEALRDGRLSFCARGILSLLLSLPDRQRADIRTLAEHTPEGRERVASATRELERYGYLSRTVKRTSAGLFFTDVEVFEAPSGATTQGSPNAEFPGSGSTDSPPDDDQTVNERDEKPSLPAPARDAEPAPEEEEDPETRAGAAALARVARAEPKLALGRCEARRLAPLVNEWRRRGASDLHVINALTAGLPRGGVYHPARFLETRLRSKMPAERFTPPTRLECDTCQRPAAVPGSCQPCRGVTVTAPRAGEFTQVRLRGVALARAALRGLAIDATMPAAA